MIRLDFLTNFNREGEGLDSADEQGVQAIKAGTRLKSMLFVLLVYLLEISQSFSLVPIL